MERQRESANMDGRATHPRWHVNLCESECLRVCVGVPVSMPGSALLSDEHRSITHKQGSQNERKTGMIPRKAGLLDSEYMDPLRSMYILRSHRRAQSPNERHYHT